MKLESTKVIYGKNKIDYLAKYIKKKQNVLFVTSKNGKKRIENKFFFKELQKKSNISWCSDIRSNLDVSYYIKKKIKDNIDVVVGFGGGSVIDASKIISFFIKTLSNNKFISKIKNSNKLITKKTIKLIAIPTTAGTGSEVTSYATMWDFRKKKKISLNDPRIKPDIAIIDPGLLKSLSEENIIYPALDALNQAFESFWNSNNKKIILGYQKKAIKNSILGFKNFFKGKFCLNYFSKASLYSGYCINYTKTSICHSISYPLTLYYKVPHGLACSYTMLNVMRYVYNKDNSFFNSLLAVMRIKHFEKLYDEIFYILNKLNLKKRIRKYASSKDIKKIIYKMIDKNRSKNFSYKIDYKTIKKFLNE